MTPFLAAILFRLMILKKYLLILFTTMIILTTVVILALFSYSYLSVLAAETMPRENHNWNEVTRGSEASVEKVFPL